MKSEQQVLKENPMPAGYYRWLGTRIDCQYMRDRWNFAPDFQRAEWEACHDSI